MTTIRASHAAAPPAGFAARALYKALAAEVVIFALAVSLIAFMS
ncbi:MAG: hypothetical protein AAFN79_08715 [Pseudomonadota bacterium]